MKIETRPQTEMLFHYTCEFSAVNVINLFWQKNQTPDPDALTNFIGVKVPAGADPARLEDQMGKIEPPPNPATWHSDIAEWAAGLRAVRQAKDIFRMVELGCTWAPWLNNLGMAARSIGLHVDLIGIEGNEQHLIHADQTLRMNGFEDDDFALYHAIAAPVRGQALIPKGAGDVIFYPDEATLAQARNDPDMQVLHCVPLSDMSHKEKIDLLHMNIHGAELDYVEANFEDIVSHARRVLIRTNSRSLEGRLIEHFQAARWRLEMERPACAPIEAFKPQTSITGVQMWANPVVI